MHDDRARPGKLTTALWAEFLGAFALVFVGAGAAALRVGGAVGVALAHGLVLAGLAAAFGPLSGCHVNPAVTFACWLDRRIGAGRAAAFAVAQLSGAAAAAFWLRACFGGTATGLGRAVRARGLEAGGVLLDVTPNVGFAVEATLAFLLVAAYLRLAPVREGDAGPGPAIGLWLAALSLAGGPLTGAPLNPARAFGPALATGAYAELWIYLAGPLAGAAAAAVAHRLVGHLEKR